MLNKGNTVEGLDLVPYAFMLAFVAVQFVPAMQVDSFCL
jgi:hypothetical protein